MKKKILLILIFLSILFLILSIHNKSYAKSYSIDDMDIQATITPNGDVKISQKILYTFNGSYNGVYLTIPFNLEDVEAEEAINGTRFNDNLYNGSEVAVNRVSVVSGGREDLYTQTTNAVNGRSGVYTSEKENGIWRIKVFSPSTNTTKQFRIDYTIKNLCVKHNDVSELYYNFIGGDWDVPIKNLNIDIYLPNNHGELYIWGHGPYNGVSKIVSNQHANFKVSNIGKGQYVAARLMFDANSLQSSKRSNVNAKSIILADEERIFDNRDSKNRFTIGVMIFALVLVIYWIILMLVFEKDKKYDVTNLDEDEIFSRYNPMVAGCLQGSRDILSRDIIAVILELVNKKIINLEFQKTAEGKENYRYIISRNIEKETEMDPVEKYLHLWLFGFNNHTVDLQKRLEEMPKEGDANVRFRELNRRVKDTLNSVGANQPRVPKGLRIFNDFLLILSIVLIFRHIAYNGLNIYTGNLINLLPFVKLLYMGIIAIGSFLYIPIQIVVITRHQISHIVQKVTGQKSVITAISLSILFAVIIGLTIAFVPAKFIVADELLLGICLIIVLTDNLMLKNNPIISEDYSKLNLLKNRIVDYTMMEDRDVEQVKLWGRYLSYGISFGIANKIINRIHGLFLDEDLEKLANSNISKYITSDYYHFYRYASLDRRFARQYGKVARTLLRAGARSRRKPDEAVASAEVADSLVAVAEEEAGGAF